MPSSAAMFYGAVAVVSAALVHGVAMRLPGVVNATPLLTSEACFAQPFARHFPLPPALDQLACAVTSSFLSLRGPARAAADVLGALLLPATSVMVYESLRPVHRLSTAGTFARCASLWMLVAQLFGGVCYAAFFLAATLSTATGGRRAHAAATKTPKPGKALLGYALPSPPQAWGTLAAVVAGTLPGLAMIVTGWSYTATAIWQLFPLGVLAAAALSPPLIARLFPFAREDGSRAFAVVALAAAAVPLSLAAHIRLLLSSPGDALLLRPQADTQSLGYAMHVLFVAELGIITLTNAVWVLTADGGSGPDVRGRFLLFGLLTCLLGPGGALALMWGYREVCLAFAYERIDQGESARLEEDEGKIEL